LRFIRCWYLRLSSRPLRFAANLSVDMTSMAASMNTASKAGNWAVNSKRIAPQLVQVAHPDAARIAGESTVVLTIWFYLARALC
jgi:hypothetical protein